MAPSERSQVGEASCLGAHIEPGFPKRQCFHIQGTRHRPPAVELLRAGNPQTRSRSHPAAMVIAGDFRSCRLSDTSFRSVQASGFPPSIGNSTVTVIAMQCYLVTSSVRTL